MSQFLDALIFGYRQIKQASTLFPQHSLLTFAGSGVTVTDDPSNDQTLVTITSGGGGSSVTWSDDLVGSTSTDQYVSAISGNLGLGGTIPINAAALQFAAAQLSPSIKQATTTAASGQDLTIRAQGATGSSHDGGNLILSGGTSALGTPGSVKIPAFGIAGIIHNSAAGALSSSQLIDADVATAAAIAVTKLAAGTAAQLLLNNATPAATWTTVTGDVLISNAGATNVAKLQGVTLTAGSPSTNDILKYNGSAWVNGSEAAGVTWLNDLAGSTGSNQYVAAISGNAGAGGTIPVNATGLQFGATQASPAVNQASTSAASGQNLTIQAQGATGASHNGGNLVLAGGTSGSGTAGSVQVPALSVAGVLHNDSSGTLTTSTVVNADVSATASIAVSKLAAGTAAQLLLNNATPAPTWTSVSGDVALSNAGVATVNNIHGGSVPVAGSLVTGNTLQVSGVSALSYGALNLAGGSNYVTGTLPAGNLPSLAGDVTGPVGTTNVAKLQGITLTASSPNTSDALRYNGSAWITTPSYTQALTVDGSGVTAGDAIGPSGTTQIVKKATGTTPFTGVALLTAAGSAVTASQSAGLVSQAILPSLTAGSEANGVVDTTLGHVVRKTMIDGSEIYAGLVDAVGNLNIGRSKASGTAPSFVVNVKAAPYNAKGTGLVDDSAAIQAACDACSASGVSSGLRVEFPAGSYLCDTPPTVDKAIKFVGVGSGRAVDPTTRVGVSEIIFTGGVGKDFGFLVNNASTSSSGSTGELCTFENLSFRATTNVTRTVWASATVKSVGDEVITATRNGYYYKATAVTLDAKTGSSEGGVAFPDALWNANSVNGTLISDVSHTAVTDNHVTWATHLEFSAVRLQAPAIFRDCAFINFDGAGIVSAYTSSVAPSTKTIVDNCYFWGSSTGSGATPRAALICAGAAGNEFHVIGGNTRGTKYGLIDECPVGSNVAGMMFHNVRTSVILATGGGGVIAGCTIAGVCGAATLEPNVTSSQMAVVGGNLTYTAASAFQGLFGGNTVQDMGSDANLSLSTNRSSVVTITDTGHAVTAIRNVTLPLAAGSHRFVENTTDKPLVFQGASGTGVTLLPGQGCNIYCDGTNWYDVNGTLAAQDGLKTTNATPTVLHRYAPLDGTIFAITCEVVAKNTSAAAGAWFQLRAVWRRNGTVFVVVRAPEVVASNSESSLSTATAVLSSEGTGSAIITVTGVAATNVQWNIVRQSIEVR